MPQITRTKLGAANFGPWENIVRVLILVWFMLYTLNAIPDIHPLVGRIAAGEILKILRHHDFQQLRVSKAGMRGDIPCISALSVRTMRLRLSAKLSFVPVPA